MITCPNCKSSSNHRMRRKKRVRIIPGSQTYACDQCNKTYTWIPWMKKSILVG